MLRKKQPEWTRLEPPFADRTQSGALFLSYAKKLTRLSDVESYEERRHAIQAACQAFMETTPTWPVPDRQMLTAAGLVLTDLTEQGWQLRVRKGVIEVRLPEKILEDAEAEKERVRQQELVKRDAQLRQSAVQGFIRTMERRRLYQGRFVSIFSLMRDGRALAEALRQARATRSEAALDGIIDPYLQFVAPGQQCPWTGFELQEIWRYFRHTWTNQYTSVPGRSMMFLVRDRAVEFHPVMGIGALCSPIVQIEMRDQKLGWHPSTFLEQIREEPTMAIACWLQRIVDEAIAEIYIDDFLEEKLLTLEMLRAPTPALIEALLKKSTEQRELHHRYVQQADHKRPRSADLDAEEQHWKDRARTHLFRSKRTLSLAELLNAKLVLLRHFNQSPSVEKLAALLEDPEGVQVVRRIVRKAKGDRVGIAMADISVCGAVQPYSAILGGKLVSMLAVSPEMVLAYRSRYEKAESEIASAMAGRPIVRPPHLVFFGTTSLYGVGLSQYTRIQIPAEVLGGQRGEAIRYQRMGRSDAFGTSQYSDDTVKALVDLVQQVSGGQRVNSIFGEGQSPKLRKVREGLEKLKFPSDVLLNHGRERIVYGVTLIRNPRDFLLGIDPAPDYLVPLSEGPAATKKIAVWWKRRWLSHRIESDAVLAEVERHTLVHPISHGARVPRPKDENQESLPFPSPY